MTITIVSLFLPYIILLVALIIGWNIAILGKDGKAQFTIDEPLISVIIPARNEASGIEHLLYDLSLQQYRNVEVIVVDDHSDDKTLEIAQRYTEKDARFRLLRSVGKGKKEALTLGIRLASGSIIVTTDADCRVAENWVAGLCNYFVANEVKMVFGGVRMSGISFFSKVQSLEFVSLIGSGAATAGLGLPTMCNGANLAFRKSVFEEVGGYADNLHIASGDDEFLMRKVMKQYPKGIVFAADPSTVVTTLPHIKFEDFVHQRIRWAGKWRLHQSFFTKAIALLVFCFQTTLIISPVLVLFQYISPDLGLLLWGTKVGLEFLFLWRVSAFLRLSWSWPAFILLQVVYPFYAVIIGILSNFSSFVWKGRKSTR